MRMWPVALTLTFAIFCVAQDKQVPPGKTEPTQQTSGGHLPPAAQRDVNGKAPKGTPQSGAKPQTGKTGVHGTAIPDTTTATGGVETPAYMTNTGAAQQPERNMTGWTPPPNPQSHPGAPPNWQQAGQLQQHADANAAKAIEAEMGGAPGGGTLGINNVTPSYNTKGQGAQTRSAQQTSPTGNAVGAQGQAAKRKPAPKPSPTQPQR
jgi:hypothetical protein